MPPSNKRVPAIRFSCFVEEWKENKVADLAERFYGGGTPSTIASEYWGGETAWIQSSDLGEGELFNVVPKRKVTLKALKETNIQLIPANSIAVVTRVGVGKLALMEYSYTTSQDFCSLANLRVNPAMLSYLLYLELNYKGVSVQGTAIKGITKNDLDSINLFIPDGRSEQARIGQFFRTLDKLIELRKKKLDKSIIILRAFAFFSDLSHKDSATLMGWLSASPFPSDQGESSSLSPLAPSLRGDSYLGRGYAPLPITLPRQLRRCMLSFCSISFSLSILLLPSSLSTSSSLS